MRRALTAAAVAAVAVGILIGAAMRNVPARIALALAGGGRSRSCGMEAALDCAFRDLPDVIGTLIKFALIMVALSAVMAIAGVVMVTAAAIRLRQSTLTSPLVAGYLSAIAVGTALVLPPVLLLLSFVVFLAR